MIIGQAPGRTEIGLGLPFAGDAGKRLVGWLALAGVTLRDFRERWYVSSIGKCYPGRAPGASADRPPSREEIAMWAPHLREELRLVAPALVVLVGRLAHRYAFGDRRLNDLVGEKLRWSGATALCLPHPSGASTWLNDAGHAELWRRALALLGREWEAIHRG